MKRFIAIVGHDRGALSRHVSRLRQVAVELGCSYWTVGDALALAAFPSLIDPMPSRPIERILKYKSMEAYDTFRY